MSLPKIASRDEWVIARKELLAEEKAMTRRRDALNTKRRQLPMVEIDKGYAFEGPDGKASLLELFDGRRQLIVQHLKWMLEGSSEQPGHSMFLRRDERVFHTYSMFARGAEMLGGSYYFLDLTALGRQEKWEEPKDRATDARDNIPDFST